jgi:hypothetical protein
MWVAGWQVMASHQTEMKPDDKPGGTHKVETLVRCWNKQWRITNSVVQVSRLQAGCMWNIDSNSML